MKHSPMDDFQKTVAWIRSLAWNPPQTRRHHNGAHYNHSRSSGERILTSNSYRYLKNQSGKKNQIKEMEIPTGKDLRMLDGSDFWLESSSEERLHVRTA